MGFIDFLVSKQPFLRKRLRIALINQEPKEYVKKAVKSSVTMGFGAGAATFFILAQKEPSLMIPLVATVFMTLYMYFITMKKIVHLLPLLPHLKIRQVLKLLIKFTKYLCVNNCGLLKL